MARWFNLVLFRRFGGRRRRCRWYQGRCWERQRRTPLDSWCSVCSPWGAGCQKPKTATENKTDIFLFISDRNDHTLLTTGNGLTVYMYPYHRKQYGSEDSVDGIQPGYLKGKNDLISWSDFQFTSAFDGTISWLCEHCPHFSLNDVTAVFDSHTYILKGKDDCQHQSRKEHDHAEDKEHTLVGCHIELDGESTWNKTC